MAILLGNRLEFLSTKGNRTSLNILLRCTAPTTNRIPDHQQNCHPDRSAPRISCTRHPPTTTCAAFSKESRMRFRDATNLDRKSGGAQWRDLRFFSEISSSHTPAKSPRRL